jgi:hypothetical protein
VAVAAGAFTDKGTPNDPSDRTLNQGQHHEAFQIKNSTPRMSELADEQVIIHRQVFLDITPLPLIAAASCREWKEITSIRSKT